MALDIGALTGQIAIEDQVSSTLNTIIANVEQFAKRFDGALGVVAIGAGAAATAIAGVTAAVTSLASRGADIDDVAGSLEQFSGSATEAKKILDALNEGTHDTISNFDLMKSSSKLLAAGVKITSDDFGTLAKAAYALQNQGFGPTKQVLDTLNNALLTGRTRSLQFMGITVDLEAAENKYAETLHKKRSELDALEKKEADRRAILEALTGTVQRAGKQEEDFNDILDQGRKAVGDWFDKLAQGVSGSRVINESFRSIKDQLLGAFGGDSQKVIDTVVGKLETFSKFLANDLVPWLIKGAQEAAAFFKVLWDNREAVTIILGIAAALKGIALAQAGIAAVTTTLGLFSTGVSAAGVAATGAAGTAAAGTGVAGLIALLTNPIGQAILAGAALGGAIVILGNRLDKYRQQLHDAIEETKKIQPLEHVPWTRDPKQDYVDPKKALEMAAAQSGPLIVEWPGAKVNVGSGRPTPGIPSDAEKKRLEEVQKIQQGLYGTDAIQKAETYAAAIKNVGDIAGFTVDKQKELRAAIQAGVEASEWAGKEIPKNWRDIIEATEDLYSAAATVPDAIKETGQVLGGQLSKLKIEVTQLAIEAQNGAARLGGLGENMVPGLTQAQLKAAGVTGTIVEGSKKSKEGLDQTAEACNGLARSFEMLSNIAGGKLGTVAQAIGNIFGGMEVGRTAGAGLKKSMDEFTNEDMLSSISNVATNIMGIVGALDAATSSSNHFANALGGALAGAQAGSAFGPLGTVFGAIGGGLFGALRGIGGPSKQELAGREELDSFISSLQGALKATDELQVHQLIAQGQSESWAKAIIGLERAYTDAGMSAEEAASKAGEKYNELFAATTQGGNAVALVIDGINQEIDILTEQNREAADAAVQAQADAEAAARRQQDLVDELSGKNAAASANDMVAALEKIGGVAHLTSSEMERVHDTLATAIEKYEAMGQEVPDIWREIADATAESTKKTQEATEAVARFHSELEKRFHNIGIDFEHATIGEIAEALVGQVMDQWGNPVSKQWIEDWLNANGISDIGRLLAGAAGNITYSINPRFRSFQEGTPDLGFEDFGRGRWARLHGHEAVVPEHRAAEFAARYGGGWDDTALRREMALMRSDLSRLFEQLPIQFRDAAQSVVIRR